MATDDEKVILRNIDKEYKYIERDVMGNLYAYKDISCTTYIRVFNHLFQFIHKEPYNIEDLLKEE